MVTSEEEIKIMIERISEACNAAMPKRYVGKKNLKKCILVERRTFTIKQSGKKNLPTKIKKIWFRCK